MTFKIFANYLQTLEKTSSRLEMTAQLADLFKKLEINEVAPACYLMQGKLVPKYQSLEFSLSVKMLIRVLARLLSKNGGGEVQSQTMNLFEETEFRKIS